ncbi:MAG: ferritin [Methanosaeta sp. PtaB.Bin039]|nr:MAG: ferritin [Methanosaeta sp. PtaB.Bin039]OPY47361.1 MAG: ferritin [Methanosaeta sp. PtaU1.Bin028]
MLSAKMLEALNKQVNWELYSSYFYLSMSSYFESANLKGFARWMNAQAKEELFHAMKFYDYIVSRGGRVILAQIDTPPAEWPSALKVFEDVYAHEKKVTGLIHGLMDMAKEEKDHPTEIMLQWFVNEQVEEEENAEAAVSKLKMVSGDKGLGLMYMLDQEMGQRVFTPPSSKK